MRMRVSCVVGLLVLVLSASGCRRPDAPADPPEISKVKAALAERERKIQSYRYRAVTEQGEQRAELSFAFRAPNKMRGDIASPKVCFAFDGGRFVQWDEANRYFTEIDLRSTPRENAQLFLHKVFAPFAPEGWRAPLLGGRLTVESVVEAGNPRIAVTAEASADGETVAITYLFASPAMDFLGKSVRGGGSLQVRAQHCDPALGLCFPSAIEEAPPAGPKLTTRISDIEINAPIPAEFFAPQAPEGVQPVRRALP